MEYVIIGNGVAGTTAAAAIRKNDPSGTIRMITDEAQPFYSRIRLMEYLSGEVDPAKLQIKKDAWYAENRIDLILNDRVTGIAPAEREVATASGKKFRYDRLLLATGADSFLPPITGAGKPGVFTLRNIRDAEAIKQYAAGKKKALLIGGGLLGLEVGNSLRKAGLEVSVAEFFPRLLPRQTDPACAELLKGRLEQMGFIFYLGVKSKEIAGEAAAQGLILEDGRRIDTDLVIVSAGVRPSLELAKKAGIKVDKGIAVNDRLETDIPGIYAAGDAVEHRGLVYGIWPAAEQQGEIAGTDMAGGSAEYHGTTFSNQLKVVGIDLLAVGDLDPDGKLESFVDMNREVGTYRKLVLKDNTIAGVLLFGSLEGRGKLLKAVEQKTDVSGIKEQLARFDLSGL
ncbi:MAG: FAD-dependent oxidoreductase [Desulfobacterota bacterium]|jgi:nitrite reductase (NADH) large subunit|nr:FAD-dependent oxidoreductase [Thermodesulfobacteriota bacterium]